MDELTIHMALIRQQIQFSVDTPSWNAIKEKLENITGLIINYEEVTPSQIELSSKPFSRPIEIEITQKLVSIYFLPGRPSYLDWNVVRALTELGGAYNGKPIPQSVKKKWSKLSWWYRHLHS